MPACQPPRKVSKPAKKCIGILGAQWTLQYLLVENLLRDLQVSGIRLRDFEGPPKGGTAEVLPTRLALGHNLEASNNINIESELKEYHAELSVETSLEFPFHRDWQIPQQNGKRSVSNL